MNNETKDHFSQDTVKLCSNLMKRSEAQTDINLILMNMSDKIYKIENHVALEMARLETKVEMLSTNILNIWDNNKIVSETHSYHTTRIEQLENKLSIHSDKIDQRGQQIIDLQKVEEQHVLSWGRLTDQSKEQRRRIELLEETVSDLIDKITQIANWCYREK